MVPWGELSPQHSSPQLSAIMAGRGARVKKAARLMDGRLGAMMAANRDRTARDRDADGRDAVNGQKEESACRSFR